jgi:hypothetical protein
VKAGKIFQGVFYLSRTNFLEGTVNVEGRDPILVQVEHAQQQDAYKTEFRIQSGPLIRIRNPDLDPGGQK